VCDLLQKVTESNIAARGVDYVHGTARLGGDGVVVITEEGGGERRLQAKNILIATGSRPSRAQGISFDVPGVCGTDAIHHRGWVPKDIVIVGGGPVGVEFATICQALGARVTVVDRAQRLMAAMDAEIAALMEQLFVEWGVQVRHGCTVERVTARGDALEVR